MNGGTSATSGILVIDSRGVVFSLLRSLNLGVPLWRVTTRSDVADLDVGLAVFASYDAPDWTVLGDLAEHFTTVLVATAANHEDACHAVSCGAFGYVDVRLRSDALRRSILGAFNGEHAYSRRVLASLIRNGRWLRKGVERSIRARCTRSAIRRERSPPLPASARKEDRSYQQF